ncbi:MAG TPA: thermonuclease family protein [Sphingomicrobium sp.]|nr:thermonuclease family protein [Sphingomicrobium sp.]
MIRFLSLVASTALFVSVAAGAQSQFSGTGRAKDGDSLMVGDKEVRLVGIDAPELGQTCQRDGQNWACGAAAKDLLISLMRGKTVFCSQTGTDQYRRVLAQCVAGTTDLNRTMVASGYAVAFRRYSTDYVSAEDSAKVNKRGLWSGNFTMPSEYRHASQPPAQVKRAPERRSGRASSNDWAGRAQANCTIKGNRNRRGQWIYHVPGMPYYDQTRAEELFCSEAEAAAAGYRRAIVR